MFDKKASASESNPSKDGSVDKSKAAPATNQPAAQPDKKPDAAAPARKA